MATKKTATVPVDAASRVRGFIVHLGDDLSARKRNAALRAIRSGVREFAEAVDERTLRRARPLGRGSADVLIPLRRRQAVDVAQAWNVVHALRRNRLVADAEPAVRIVSGIAQPAGPRMRAIGPGGQPLPQAGNRRWSLDNARITGLWPTTQGSGIIVGHPDTGYTHHPQIDNARLLALRGYDFEEDRADPLDTMTGFSPGHGTGTASVIMSADAPDPGVFGAAPDVRLVPYRVSDSVVHFDFTNLTQALYRARDDNCDLVSMSLGGPWAGRALGRAADAVIAADVILLAAAGNVWPWVVYPAKFDNVVAVAASNAIDEPWKDSAHGDEVDISAPGESVWRAFSHEDNGALQFDVDPSSGTSYAVATTAGACALWLSHHGRAALRARYPGRLAAVFMDLLTSAGFRSVPGWKTSKYGPGILDATALINAALPVQAPAVVARMRAAIAPGERAFAWARLQPFFPELSPEQLARAVVPMFGKRPAAAARALADVIDEVEYFVATDPAVRASIIAAAQPPPRARIAKAPKGPRAAIVAPVRKRRGAALAVPDPKHALRAVASARLRAALR